jgi:2-hydroxy-4-carboxymuconate semialdehyde hemiacetal dehydrogenase
MAQRMGVVVAGEGAIARQHMAALGRMDDVDVIGVAGGDASGTAAFAAEFGIPRHGLDLAEMLDQPRVDAAILASPTPVHAAQAIQVMDAGKHVLIEIPMADSLADAEAVVAAQRRTGVTAMVCHTRRFNPSHQWIHHRIVSGELTLQHLVALTLFLRRENKNALGQPRSWTDHLLWHHACHTVDLFLHQTGEIPAKAWAQQGPPHPELGIAMDMTVGLQAPSGALCTLALSFNNDGPLGTTFRYIGDTGTYIARYDDLVDGHDKPIDVSGVGGSMDGIENQDREFFAAVREGREPAASVAQCLPTMRTLDRLERTL